MHQKNPHDFDFNIHPTSIKQYTQLLMNPKKNQIKIDKSQIYKYYFYMNIFYKKLVIQRLSKMEKKVKESI